MKFVADLHIHSKYSRATSPDMSLEGLAKWAKIKGIDLIATGDFAHPKWISEIQSKAAEGEDGFLHFSGQKFILSVEVNNKWHTDDGKLHQIHTVALVPSIDIAKQVNEMLSKYGNLGIDGRPTVLLSCEEMAANIFEICSKAIIFPAHIWTPWFSAFGMRGGFDSLKQVFGSEAGKIYAIETGLSSDPPMNWRLSELDRVQLISNSDSHSPAKIGREANVFDLGRLSYDEIYEAIRYKGKGRLKATYEFFPEEGKYHYDGHRACNISLHPSETRKMGGICPMCRKKLTVGVMHRVEDLADREEGYRPKNSPDFESLVPLQEIIAMALGCGVYTKKTYAQYHDIIRKFGNEFAALHASREEIAKVADVRVAEAVERVQKRRICLEPGYDGVFGKVLLKKPEERESGKNKGVQKKLGEY